MDFEQVVLPNARQCMLTAGSDGQAYRIFIAILSGEAPAGGYPVLYMLEGNAGFATFALTVAVLSIWRAGPTSCP